jgi:PAS domain S-box-containing protein
MQITYHPYILLPLVTLFIALVIVVRAWRYRTRPIAMIFLVMMLALAEWSLAAFLEHASLELPAKVLWIKMTYFGITTIPVTWLIFTLRYTNREKWLTRRNIAILAILPVVTLVMVWTNNIHHLMWKDIWLDTSLSLPIDVVTHNAWFWVYAIYAYSLILLGTVCLFTTFLRSTGIYRKQVGAMLFASLVPWVANFLFIGGIEPFSVVDPTPLAFAITGVIFYWGLAQLQLLDIVPIAHKAIFTSIADGVIVLDTQHRIIELNPAAEYIFRCTSTDVIGQPLSRVLPEQAGLTELQPEVTKMETEIVLGEGKTQRYYRTFISPIHAQGRLNGHMLLLHDDTERRKAEIESRERARLEAELTERERSAEILRHRLELEETIARISSRFVSISDIDAAINDSLADIGKLGKVSRTYLFLLRDEETTMDNTHEWCAEGVSSQIDSLKNLPCGMFPWWMTKLSNGEVIHVTDVSKMPAEASAEKEMIESQDIKSVLVLPVFVSERLTGFIGLDSVTETVEWSDNDLAVLRISSEIIGNAFERKQAEHSIEVRVKELTCLYRVSQILNKPNADLDTVLAEAVGFIPDGWQSPEITCARVIIDDKEFKTDNFAVTEWKQSSDIIAGSEKIGALEVYYLEEKGKSDEGPFIKEERYLIDSLAGMLGEVTQLKQADIELTRLYEETKSLNLQLEARVKERTKQLEEAVTAAKVASQAKSEFLASMSHELRTPLTAIIGFSQVLQEQYLGNLNEKQAEYVSDIVDSGKHLLALINDILDLSKVEAGKMELDISSVKIKDLLQNSLVMIKEKALAHSISLETQTAEDIEGLEIMADERKLKQVMFNLLSNAVKFTPDGGAIKVEGRREGEELIISVSDTGVGISSQEQKRIFEEFYQVSGGVKDKTPGTGLGLSLTKGIVEMHGGRIWVESEGLGKGSRFTFTLPI